jgi:hypothetical protein
VNGFIMKNPKKSKMKTRFYIVVLILTMVITTGYSQGKTNGEVKEDKKLDKRSQVEMMINAREFVFVPRIALPTGMKPVNISSNQYEIKFQPDFIDSYMPFFGRAYSAAAYGNDTGLKFKGKPENFTAKKSKRSFQINAVIKGQADIFRLFLSVGSEGSASLSISSDNRSTITYQGEIYALEKTKSE